VQLPTLSRNIFISLVLAVLAAVTLVVYTNSVRDQASSAKQAIRVVVASGDIDAGTSVRDAQAQGHLVYRTMRQSDAAPGAVTNIDAVAGQVLNGDLYHGEQLTARRIGSASNQGLAYRISGVQRAMRITFKSDAGLLSDLQQGDRVDVFATYKQSSGTTTYMIARAALVLSVDNERVNASAESDTGETASGTATLSVPESQAAVLANALQGGADQTFPLYLALSPRNHPAQQHFPELVMPGGPDVQQ
jgi:Flp pilus assembly protein CpaB